MAIGSGYAARRSGVLAPSRLAQSESPAPRQGGLTGSRLTGRDRAIGYTTAPPKARQVWELHRAREESRQLALVSPHWRAYIKWANGQVLGSRPTELAFPMMAKDARKRLDPAVRALRRRWRRFHYERDLGMRGENLLYLQAQVLYTRLVDGDCFIIPREVGGRRRFMFFPGDALAENQTGHDAATGWSRALGIATDEWGLPRVYYFGFGARARPSGYMSWSAEVDPVPVAAENVWHFRERSEDGTLLRSYPWCVSAIDYIHKLHEYRGAFIRSAVARAAAQLFLSSHPEMGAYAGEAASDRSALWEQGGADANPANGADDAPVQGWQEAVLNAGEALILPPGYEAKRMDTGTPSQNDYMEVRSMERAICAALRASPMALLADYQGVSFSSAQHASGHERTSVEGFQAWVGTELLTPVYVPWFAAQWPDLMREFPELRAEDYEVLREAEHVFKPYQPLEKHRLIGPIKEAWDGGLYTLSRSRAELGEDPSDVESMIEEWKAERELFGLPAVPEGAGKPPAPDPGEYNRPPTEEEERAEAREAEGGEDGEGEGE